jgi:geranylgeranyl diphosphate synthase type I
VDLVECEDMAANKTAALIGSACSLGALFGHAGPEQVGHLRAFGERLGLAFQHVDDLLGIWGKPKITGKSVFSDLRNRKKSLPVVAALTSGTPAGDELMKLYRRSVPPNENELRRAAELVDQAGGRTWSQAQADELTTQAIARLEELGQSPAAAELTDLARLITHRDH